MIYYKKWVGKLFTKSILESPKNGVDYGSLMMSIMYYKEKWKELIYIYIYIYIYMSFNDVFCLISYIFK